MGAAQENGGQHVGPWGSGTAQETEGQRVGAAGSFGLELFL